MQHDRANRLSSLSSVFWGYILPCVVIIEALSGLHTVHGQLIRDLEACPAQALEEEFSCLRKQNSLDNIMDSIKLRSQSNQEDYYLCREIDNGLPDDNEDYYFPNTPSDGRRRICIYPRAILTDGTAAIAKAIRVGIHGAIKSCPRNDPDFRECLCGQGVDDQLLGDFASFFWPFKVGYLEQRCEHHPNLRPKLSVRDFQSMQKLSILPKRDVGKRQYSTEITLQYIDEYGIPYYTNGEPGDYPLPSFDRALADYSDGSRLAERCYVHPIEPQLECVQYMIPRSATQTLASEMPTRATYKSSTTRSATLSSEPTYGSTSSVNADFYNEASFAAEASAVSASLDATPAPASSTTSSMPQTGSAQPAPSPSVSWASGSRILSTCITSKVPLSMTSFVFFCMVFCF